MQLILINEPSLRAVRQWHQWKNILTGIMASPQTENTEWEIPFGACEINNIEHVMLNFQVRLVSGAQK